MTKIEILAPAGSIESIYAAINNDCDAIYLGGNKFSARAYASNFDNDTMIKAVDYAHSYGKYVYVTINTILKENEVEEAVKYVGFLYEIGIDAIIIQDLGLLYRVKEEFPEMEIHASTQMTIHNGESALYFKNKGFHRIVLSREMSFEEIRYISKDLKVETEIFVHGALCVAYSGQCLMSSVIGGRSGNRGRCAQPCRMEYILSGEKSGDKKGHLLSPKDMCTIDEVDKIVDSGTYSLKIEGRMKKPQYVAGVVSNYKKAVDKVLYNKKFNVEEGRKQLLQLFNRSGFTKGYVHKNTGKDMMSLDRPKNSGILLGKVDKNGEIVLKDDISLGDGIRYLDKGFTLSKIICDNKEVKEAKINQKVKIFPIDYKKGDELFKSLNKKLYDELELDLKPYYKKILLNVKVNFKEGEKLALKVSYKDKEYEFFGEEVQKAVNKPLDKEKVIENICKNHESPFKFNKVEFESFEDGFLRISDINNLRREALDEITKSITKSYRRKRPVLKYKNEEISKDCNVSEIYSCITKDQLKALLKYNAKDIALDIFSREKNSLKESDLIEAFNNNKEINFYIKTSSIVKDEFNSVCNKIDKVKKYIKGILTSNIGIMSVFKDELDIIGDYKFNIMNSKALKYYSHEINLPTLSLELTRSEIKSICKNFKGNKAVMIYGKPELMVSEYCPIGSIFGGKDSKNNCNAICMKDKFSLIDRVNETSRVMTDIYCRSYILNPVPINLISEVSNLKSFGVTSFRFDFRDESYEQVLNILDMFKNEKNFDSKQYTKGNYKRGVE